MTYLQAKANYKAILAAARDQDCRQKTARLLCQKDLFYLLVNGLHRADADKEYVYNRCREFQKSPNGHLDLAFRESYKSSIGSAAIIQRLLNDPDRTHGIFSYTRPIAKKFLVQIKQELENNIALKELFPDILYQDPKKQAPKWNENEGIVVKRKGNPKESSVEAWGLVDGQPAGPHFTDLEYDDIVTRDTVRTPGMLEKTTDAFLNSLNLGTIGGHRRARGTRWHYADTYSVIIERGILKPRIWTATKDNTFEGEPWIWTREELKRKIDDYGPYIAACQLFMDPRKDAMDVFQQDWLRYWNASRYTGLNLYILVDPASSKKQGSDYTVFILIGLGSDRNYYVINWIRDRLSLVQKANVLFKWHQQYKPVAVGYEQYGMQADIDHYKDRMQRDNYRFGIIPLGGKMSKPERIGRLIPPFYNGRVFIPETCPYTQYDQTVVDLTRIFVNDEYLAHPFEEHDDMLDCMARIMDDDLGAAFPQGKEIDPLHLERPAEEQYDPLRFGLEGKW